MSSNIDEEKKAEEQNVDEAESQNVPEFTRK